ncbi:MAG: hypothetical protein L3J31_04880, partial [Bacteroidales bacterium]|nr:hypothetical protein [Bacteroidales bacterium]
MVRFAHPEYFYLLLLVFFFLFAFWFYNNWKKRAGRRFGDKQTISLLMPQVSKGKPRFKVILVLLAFVMLVVGI